MGNPFKSIADTISGFVGDVADAWNGADGQMSPRNKYLSYPNSLANSSSSSFSYDSDIVDGDLSGYTDAKALHGGSVSPEPFIMFEFFRALEPNYDERDRLETSIDVISQVNLQRQIDGMDSDDPALNASRKAVKTLSDRVDYLNDQKGKKRLNSTVALYMTPGISVNDSMNYDQENRRLASMADDVSKAWDKDGYKGVLGAFSKEDVQLGVAKASGTAAAAILQTIPGNISKLVAGGSALALGNAIGDEAMRQMGKAMNPNEYMQYKSTQLRTFSFTWKFLPDSVQESVDCADIIKTFRAAAHANRKSSVTLTVPDQVVVSFHGASNMPALPATVLSNVSVTYNPNSASFFKQDNTPVEIDLSITLNEIMPIYRDDVEKKGY